MKKDMALEQIGLTKSEVDVYQVFLELGEMTPPQVAEATNLTRENSYAVIKSLTLKGLIERVSKKKKQSYRPLPPTKLKELITVQRLELEQKEKSLEAIIPYLSNLYSLNSKKPSVSYFEGTAEIKKIYDLALRDKPAETVVFRSAFDDRAIGYDYIKSFLEKRAKAGIKNRIIISGRDLIAPESGDEKLLRKRKLIKDELSLPAEIAIFNNKVSIISFRKDMVGFVIESADLAESLKKIFDYIWNDN